MQPSEHSPSPVLTYGTHDRGGPRWQRWGRAWLRAARPAAVAALIVAALAYALAPRRYTAEARVDAELDWVSAARGLNSSPKMDAARANALAQSLKKTGYLNGILGSPQWRHARLEHPGKTLFDPVEAEPVPGTKTVRIRFTDPSPEMARLGAETAVTALRPIDTPAGKAVAASMEQQLGPMVARERKLEADLAAAREAAASSDPGIDRKTGSLERQIWAHRRQMTPIERSVGNVPRVRTVGPAATTPRFPSNQKELLAVSLSAAALAFPLALLAALLYAWQYRQAATVQEGQGERATALAGLVTKLGPARPWRAAARLAVRPAAVAALIAGVVACWSAPRRYTATATIVSPPAATAAATAPAGSPGPTQPTAATAATAAEAYAALAGAATAPEVFSAVVNSDRWRAARDDLFARHAQASFGPDIVAASDGTSVAVRFTYGDRDAARFGADAALAAARKAVDRMPAHVRSEFVVLQRARQARRLYDPASPIALSLARYEALRSAAAQLPVSTPATVPWWPSNYRALAAAGAASAAKAFGVVFMLATVWFFRNQLREARERGGADAAGTFASARWPVELAAALALLVALTAYVATPRTYSATATLHVRPLPRGASPPGSAVVEVPPSIKLPAATFVKYVEEDVRRRVASGVVRSDLASGSVSITCTSSDPDAARNDANTYAHLAAHRLPEPLTQSDGNPPSVRRTPAALASQLAERDRAMQRMIAMGAGQRVTVAEPAQRPRWADQLMPLKTAALAGACTLVGILLGTDALRDRRSTVRLRTHAPAIAG